jgi:hypothetical protein
MATWRSELNANLNQARDRLVSMRVWLRFVALIADLELARGDRDVGATQKAPNSEPHKNAWLDI